MRRSLHPTPYSRIDNHVEATGDRLNAACLYLVPIAFFSWVFFSTPDQYANKPAKHTRPAVEQQVGDISEMDYLLAISEAKKPGRKLTSAEIAEMDMWASKATNPADVDRMKPKAKAAYYASLRGEQQVASVWEALEK